MVSQLVDKPTEQVLESPYLRVPGIQRREEALIDGVVRKVRAWVRVKETVVYDFDGRETWDYEFVTDLIPVEETRPTHICD